MDLFEFITVIVLIASIPVSVGVFALTKKGRSKAKKTALDEVVGAKDQAITSLRTELNRALGRANRYRQQLDEYQGEEEELTAESGGKAAQWEDIVTLVKKIKPEYAKALHIPMVKKEIQKMTKGQSLEEIIAMVEDLTGKKIAKGGLVDGGTTQGQDDISSELTKQVRNWA